MYHKGKFALYANIIIFFKNTRLYSAIDVTKVTLAMMLL